MDGELDDKGIGCEGRIGSVAIPPTQVGWQYTHFLTVFGNRPAGDPNPFFPENPDDLLVAEGFCGVFTFYDESDGFLNALV